MRSDFVTQHSTMSLKRLSMKSSSVHYMQNSINSLASPAFPRTSSLLQQVPEYGIVTLDIASSLDRQHTFRKNQDWNNLFQQKDVMNPGELFSLHENIRNILGSKTGPFIFDYYKQELLPRGMIILRENIRLEEGEKLLVMLEEIWNYFFKKILPALEAILYLIKTKEILTVRQTALVSFRDFILLKIKIEEALQKVNYKVSSGIKHMFLILQGVNDSYPPNKNKLKLESILARIINPFLGFRGLYQGGSEPVIPSMEPAIAARRKSADWRRISRPLSVQPQQVETLTELFINALRKQENS
ncbi:proline-rich protein 5-like isoform X2 [Centruroides sculpturatus]|uniref:proline-rich protein 5-like isoform X2 n=1 Tax=Centruroides sculpturatus TaxID=218467 RepID=UPI000C6D7EBA|nr:proline-rich protein 5-like isoform X2 [Centruroides sculpturatus]